MRARYCRQLRTLVVHNPKKRIKAGRKLQNLAQIFPKASRNPVSTEKVLLEILPTTFTLYAERATGMAQTVDIRCSELGDYRQGAANLSRCVEYLWTANRCVQCYKAEGKRKCTTAAPGPDRVPRRHARRELRRRRCEGWSTPGAPRGGQTW